MIQIRVFQPADQSQLSHFLTLAAHEDDTQSALDNPDLARYIKDWGRDADTAVVACDDAEIVGIAWARVWKPDDYGFGWVDELTPEMAIAVEAEFRNQGIGARLIGALKAELSATQVSLNVRADSPAVQLYQRLGFEKVAGSERRNRAGGVSFNMLAHLSSKISPL